MIFTVRGWDQVMIIEAATEWIICPNVTPVGWGSNNSFYP